jgi:hypothetical protein
LALNQAFHVRPVVGQPSRCGIVVTYLLAMQVSGVRVSVPRPIIRRPVRGGMSALTDELHYNQNQRSLFGSIVKKQ